MISDPVNPARTESVSLSSVATTILAELLLPVSPVLSRDSWRQRSPFCHRVKIFAVNREARVRGHGLGCKVIADARRSKDWGAGSLLIRA